MREDEFRKRLRGAFGEPPPMSAPRLGPAARPARLISNGMGLIAFLLAVLLVGVLVGSRLAFHTRGDVLPAATPSTRAVPPPAADSFPCYLPVNMVQEAGSPGQQPAVSSTMGFVNVPTGSFAADPKAFVSDLPGGGGESPRTYSAAFKRWLPIMASAISPDGQSYAFVRQLTAGSELHIVDVADRKDRKAWTTSDDAQVLGWNSAGILVFAVPHQGGLAHYWRVDPRSGAATAAPPSDDPSRPMALMTGRGGSLSYLGGDGAGRAAYRFGSRDPGTAYSVVIVESGAVTTIYAGKAGDATDFDPEGVYFDAHGLWLGNFDGTRVWLWSQTNGLRNFPVTGAPTRPSGYQYYTVTYLPAGPCIPGAFAGTGAQPLGAATPTPTPPVVDWAPLLAKPLTLQDLQPGAACPVTPQVSLTGQTNGAKKGIPSYGYGQSPVYLSGQLTWYSAGSQGVLVLTDPGYSGPVLLRAKRLDGAGSMSFSGVYSPTQTLPGGVIGIPETSSPPYWGQWDGTLTISAPGCYGIQFDGTSFSEDVVIAVRQGPPPPG